VVFLPRLPPSGDGGGADASFADGALMADADLVECQLWIQEVRATSEDRGVLDLLIAAWSSRAFRFAFFSASFLAISATLCATASPPASAARLISSAFLLLRRELIMAATGAPLLNTTPHDCQKTLGFVFSATKHSGSVVSGLLSMRSSSALVVGGEPEPRALPAVRDVGKDSEKVRELQQMLNDARSKVRSEVGAKNAVLSEESASEFETVQFELSVELEDVDDIVRTVQVAADASFFQLHRIIQLAMGWADRPSVGWEFTDPSGGLKITVNDGATDSDAVLDAASVKLCQVCKREGDVLEYEYDFQDCWVHAIRVSKILRNQVPNKGFIPICVDGTNSCPPEGVGGGPQFRQFLRVFQDSSHQGHTGVLELLQEAENVTNGLFRPGVFELQPANEAISAWHAGARASALAANSSVEARQQRANELIFAAATDEDYDFKHGEDDDDEDEDEDDDDDDSEDDDDDEGSDDDDGSDEDKENVLGDDDETQRRLAELQKDLARASAW
jgi:hypothetical protein